MEVSGYFRDYNSELTLNCQTMLDNHIWLHKILPFRMVMAMHHVNLHNRGNCRAVTCKVDDFGRIQIPKGFYYEEQYCLYLKKVGIDEVVPLILEDSRELEKYFLQYMTPEQQVLFGESCLK